MSSEQIISCVESRYPVSIKVADLIREGSDNQVWKLESQSDSHNYFLRISKRDVKADIAFEAAWLELLAKSGIPVAQLVKTTSGMPFGTSSEVGTMTLFREVAGKHLELGKGNFPNKQQISSAAESLASIHRASSGSGVAYPRQRSIFTELSRVEGIKDTLDQQELGNQEFFSAVDEYLGWAKGQDYKSVLIHNDYRVGNLLFEKDKVTAVLDFDWSCMGPAIKDVAHTLAEWSYPDGSDSHNEEVFNVFLDSYNSFAPHPIAKDSALYRWIAFSCLSDTATFVVDRIERGEPKLPRQSYMFSKFRYFRKLV